MTTTTRRSHTSRRIGRVILRASTGISRTASAAIVGKRHLSAFAGTKSKAEIAAIWSDLYAALDGALTMSVTGMIAENDQVAAEVVSDARTHDGKVYSNNYHLLITVRDGQVAAVKEYTDLMHVAEVFG